MIAKKSKIDGCYIMEVHQKAKTREWVAAVEDETLRVVTLSLHDFLGALNDMEDAGVHLGSQIREQNCKRKARLQIMYVTEWLQPVAWLGFEPISKSTNFLQALQMHVSQ
jgi:hypothetical protein